MKNLNKLIDYTIYDLLDGLLRFRVHLGVIKFYIFQGLFCRLFGLVTESITKVRSMGGMEGSRVSLIQKRIYFDLSEDFLRQ